MDSVVLCASNLHCPSCISHIQDILGRLPGISSADEVSLINQTIRVVFNSKTINHRSITNALTSSAFDIEHVALFDSHGRLVEEHDLPAASHSNASQARPQQQHIDNCNACHAEWGQYSASAKLPTTSTTAATTSNDNPAVIDIDDPSEYDPSATYTASLSIEGMSGGSCTGKISAGMEVLPFVTKVNIDLLTNSGVVDFHGKDNVDLILKNVSDLGYSATLVNLVEPRSISSPAYIATLLIEGMSCGSCIGKITTGLEGLHFVATASIDLLTNSGSVEFWGDKTNLDLILDKVNDMGYHATVVELVEPRSSLARQERVVEVQVDVFAGLVAIPSLIIGVVYMALVPSDNLTRMWFEEPMWAGNATRTEWALFIMTTPVMFFGTDLFHRRAFKEIWAMWKPSSAVPMLRRLCRFGSMNMLISVGTIVAYVSSLAVLIMNATQKTERQHMMRMSSTYFDVITFLTFFILMGRYLEAYSKAKTGDAVAMLSKLRPNQALLVGKDHEAQKVPVDQLEVGDVVQIPQGYSPPADGTVVQDGSFSFDESSLTGESKPARKTKGDTVFTGTVNVANPVEIKVTELGGASMLDQIIEVVRGGQAKRAPIERFADVLTGYFVPVVTLLAIVTWVTWLCLGLSGRLPDAWLDSAQGGWAFWSLEFAIAVFVVACPCGIGLAAPTALFVGGGLAAKQGILVQGGGQAFQEASNLNTMVFDKTGTLTQGQMRVTGYEQLNSEIGKDRIFAMARAMEGISSHPIAQAITTYCASSSEEVMISDVREIPGHGMTARFTFGLEPGENAVEAAIGNGKLLDLLNETEKVESSVKSGHSIDNKNATISSTILQQALHPHQIQGHSVAVIAIRHSSRYEAAGIFALSDPLRPEAVEVIASLRSLGLAIHLCTGDNTTTAHAIALQLNISLENVRAGVLPQEKAEYIHELQHPVEGVRKLVAFAGDGLNDTPALTAADVSISLSSGSDIAINASSFILLNSHLGGIYKLLKLSERVFLRVKMNFFWAGIYNVTLIPIAAGVLYTIGATEHHAGWRMSPVWAAVAMAGSSVSVVLSSLALKLPEVKWSFKSQRRN
ncbi:Copper-transporting ATPase ccc2 [Stemphylium lycopersici]|uniref:Copper-transporting ATPase ccc2 n=1 Tax=Stemphylium lycopersici TaxID=183478 RepID=A0A364MRX6_STELY|nr:Copper-transporting ATPase ccc2 [Stemphylium lycopersici]